MLEKIRVAVDRETESILERITHGIEDRLAERPYWSNELAAELRDTLRGLLQAKPDWVATLEQSLLTSVGEKTAQVCNGLQEVKSGLGKQMELSQQAAAAHVSELQLLKNGVDETKTDGHVASLSIAAALKDISSDLLTAVSEQRAGFEQLAATTPGWATSLETSLLTLAQGEAATGEKILQGVNSVGICLSEQRGHLQQAIAALKPELEQIRTEIDQAKVVSRENSETTSALIKVVGDAVERLEDSAGREADQLRTALKEQQAMVTQLAVALQELFVQVVDCRRGVESIDRPWWKKLFGGA